MTQRGKERAKKCMLEGERERGERGGRERGRREGERGERERGERGEREGRERGRERGERGEREGRERGGRGGVEAFLTVFFSGLVIWRIEKFTVREIPKPTYGRFYSGDSYILLHVNTILSSFIPLPFFFCFYIFSFPPTNVCKQTYSKYPGSHALSYDVHFWLGSKTTQDEAGTAAYKTGINLSPAPSPFSYFSSLTSLFHFSYVFP